MQHEEEINEKKNYLNILICKIKEKEKELKYLSEKERKLSILLDEDIDKLEEQLKNLRENKEKIIWAIIKSIMSAKNRFIILSC